MKSKIRSDYFNWLIDLTNTWCWKNSNEKDDYYLLLEYLYDRQFVWTMMMDGNRAQDGVETRLRFVEQSDEYDYRDVYLYLTHPCNVLEMMAALASRCEDHIMGDPSQTDNTGKWFWEMITNMHLDKMTDRYFDEQRVDEIVTNMLDRNYAKNGDGGLFKIHDDKDMRYVDIWCQLNWYLNEVAENDYA